MSPLLLDKDMHIAEKDIPDSLLLLRQSLDVFHGDISGRWVDGGVLRVMSL